MFNCILEFQPSSLMQYARQLSEKENNSLLHQSNVSSIFD